MGTMHFRLPRSLPAEASAALAHAYLAGLPDYMPAATLIHVQGEALTASKEQPESSCLYVPWALPVLENGPARQIYQNPERLWPSGPNPLPLILATATLGEREQPYQFLLELARGKVNQVRNQAADWQGGGLVLNEQMVGALRDCALAFAKAVCRATPTDEADELAEGALAHAVATGEELVRLYVQQVFEARQQRTLKLPVGFSCGLTGSPPDGTLSEQFLATFNSVRLPFSWREVEPRESSYFWDPYDARLAWAKSKGLQVEGGPLIDLHTPRLPVWLDHCKGDPQSLANVMLDYMETALERYRGDIKIWQITAGCNAAEALSIDDEDVFWLNTQLWAAAQQIHPDGEFGLTLTQPWSESLARGTRAYSTFAFADALLRSRAPVASLELEIAMGMGGRGSLCRDALETSRLLDLYALLGTPLRVVLACPSEFQADADADPEYVLGTPGYGQWTLADHAAWGARFAALAACKPFVVGVSWAHWSDAHPHLLPHAGLLDRTGTAKPLLRELTQLRASRIL